MYSDQYDTIIKMLQLLLETSLLIHRIKQYREQMLPYENLFETF